MGKGNNQIPVGLERVLYLAATEPAFKAALEADPEQAVQERGLELRPSELAMLRAVSPDMLLSHADGVDPSADNLKRRTFLRAVAASAVTVGAADALSGCKSTSLGVRPDDDLSSGKRDAAPEAGSDASTDSAEPDTVAAPDMAGQTNGIRPGGG